MALEVITFVAVGIFLVIATAMAVAGLLGIAGALRLVRCPACRHLVVADPGGAASCPYCRHERALHMVHLDHGLHRHAGHAAEL